MLVLLLAVLNFSNCELLKPVSQNNDNKSEQNDELDPIQGRRVYDPVTGTYVVVENAPSEIMDTILWRDIPSSLEPPIYSTGAPVTPGPIGNPVQPIGIGEAGSELLSSYNVAVVLPFLTDRFSVSTNEIPDNSQWALQFYSGMEMAFDELSTEGIALNVSVLDSKASEQTVGALARTNTDIANAHLVIGPYRRNNAAILAERMRVTGGVLVSPHSAASNVSDRNPNYVQVAPTLKTHCEVIMQHVNERYRPEQVVLVGMDLQDEVARFEYFQREHQRLTGLMDTTRLRELAIDTARLDMQSVDLKPYLGYDDETVFILPSWSNELFVYNFLRKLDLDRNQYQRVVVYGMPQWMTYERIDFDYYEKLNVHISSAVFVDGFDADIRQFKRSFYDRFGAVPTPEAYLGYDITRYFGRMINEYGTRFQYLISGDQQEMLHTKFDFHSVVIPSASSAEVPIIQRWENRYVNILQFRNYRFQLAE